MTEYTLLHYNSETNSWERIRGNVVASSPRRALIAASAQAGEYVAVPARSWKPLTVSIEQTTKVTIG